MSPQTANDLRSAFNRYSLKMGSGQFLDLGVNKPDLSSCWNIANQKSGSFFALGCLVGAKIVTDDAMILRNLEIYGSHLGTILQAANDIQGLWGDRPGHSDLAQNKKNIAVAFALEALPLTEADRLRCLLDQAPQSPDAETDALDMIVKSGGLIYLKLEIESRKNVARNIIRDLNLHSNEILFALIDQRGAIHDPSI